MELDLGPDVAPLGALLRKAVSDYTKKHSASATKAAHPAVKRMDFVYTFGMAEVPLLRINFNSKTAEPGHMPTHQGQLTEYPRWNAARLAAEDGGRVTLRSPWAVVEVESEDEFDRAMGEFFVELIREARDAGMFNPLPRASGCEFGVSAYDGSFGWPPYKERGQANLL